MDTVYEFHGSYWHGDPTVYQREEMLLSKTAGQLYDETIERENIIKSLGYNLVVMWESEWNGMLRMEVKRPYSRCLLLGSWGGGISVHFGALSVFYSRNIDI
jgi:hypothetical protein